MVTLIFSVRAQVHLEQGQRVKSKKASQDECPNGAYNRKYTYSSKLQCWIMKIKGCFRCIQKKSNKLVSRQMLTGENAKIELCFGSVCAHKYVLMCVENRGQWIKLDNFNNAHVFFSKFSPFYFQISTTLFSILIRHTFLLK